MEKLEIFGFQAMWSPGYLLFTLVLGIFYILLVKGVIFRGTDKENEGVSSKQIFYFITAVVLLYIVKGSPVDLLGHLNFSMHMVQMSVLYLVCTPLFIMGTPNWLLRKVLQIKGIAKLENALTKPLIALLLFNGVFSFYHFPFIFDVIKTSTILHALVTGLLFLCAFVMWWPLICPLPEFQKLSGLKKLGYIFADGILLTPACALIIFANEPLFTTYSDPAAWAKALELCVPAGMLANIDLSGPQMFSWLAPLDDQQLGGVIMKIIQEIVYGITLGAVFFQWVREEKKKDAEEQMSMSPTPQFIK
ncbi:cytochrome c oxidase assembly factor CtaG [Bacillus sp. Marseille-P3661]|uniref:cytochrome c oxidase assembly factor CtaG n=1 Tax=Bacillus sp. Marseille-P3661 TaxID=1936234 RepID=UPI0011589932|nr:cytochrome c oxidase assembly factor CtaG [Bacillus sp. Marseille-P3661]